MGDVTVQIIYNYRREVPFSAQNCYSGSLCLTAGGIFAINFSVVGLYKRGYTYNKLHHGDFEPANQINCTYSSHYFKSKLTYLSETRSNGYASSESLFLTGKNLFSFQNCHRACFGIRIEESLGHHFYIMLRVIPYYNEEVKTVLAAEL